MCAGQAYLIRFGRCADRNDCAAPPEYPCRTQRRSVSWPEVLVPASLAFHRSPVAGGGQSGSSPEDCSELAEGKRGLRGAEPAGQAMSVVPQTHLCRGCNAACASLTAANSQFSAGAVRCAYPHPSRACCARIDCSRRVRCRRLMKVLTGAAGLAAAVGFASPAAAQYYPGYGYGYNNGGVVGAIVNSVLGGGQYGYGTSMAMAGQRPLCRRPVQPRRLGPPRRQLRLWLQWL